MKRLIFFIRVLLIAAVLAGATPALAQGPELPEAAERFCTRFFQLLDQGKFKESFALVAPVMGARESDYIGVVSERTALGDISKRRVSQVENVTTFADLPDGQYLKIVFETSFKVQPEAKEILVLDKLDTGEYGLAGYQVLYNRWPEAIRMIGNGLFLVFFIMGVLAGITWLVGRLVQSVEKAKKEKASKEG